MVERERLRDLVDNWILAIRGVSELVLPLP
jgi:hypothetical protein